MNKMVRIGRFCTEARDLVQQFVRECAENNISISYDAFALWLTLKSTSENYSVLPF
jgi:hypothetical protein